VIEITRHLPLPVAAAYAWLTDFRDDDPARAGAMLTERRVTERTATRVAFEGEHKTLGRRIRYAQVVDLSPPDAWRSRVVSGPRLGSHNEYSLAPDGAGSRLTVRYHLTHEKPGTRALIRIAKPILRRNLVRMWQGYERAMREES
jgi:hypothetical protein